MKKIISIVLLVILGATLSIGIISYVRGGLVYNWFNPEVEIEDTEKDQPNKDENQGGNQTGGENQDENDDETNKDENQGGNQTGGDINEEPTQLIYMLEDDSLSLNMLYTAPFYGNIDNFENLEFTVTGVGSVILSSSEYYRSSGKTTWYDLADKYVSLDELKDELLSVELVEGTLQIKVKKFVENYYGSRSLLDGGRTIAYKNKFRRYPDGITASDCYFLIDVKDTVTKLQKQFKIIVE